MSYKQNRWKNVLYVGVTNSLERRVWQHKNKAVPGFTKQYNCDRLVYFEQYDEIDQAIAARSGKTWQLIGSPPMGRGSFASLRMTRGR